MAAALVVPVALEAPEVKELLAPPPPPTEVGKREAQVVWVIIISTSPDGQRRPTVGIKCEMPLVVVTTKLGLTGIEEAPALLAQEFFHIQAVVR